MERRPPQRVPSDEARRELARDLLDVPELFQGQVDGIFEVKAAPSDERTTKGYARVGIVFVHGVGSQRKGDTLREFGTPLVDWVEEWHRDRTTGFRVTWSELAPQGAEPAAAGLIIPDWKDDATGDVHPGQVWVLTEAWWAPRVEPPPLKTMVFWARQRVWRLIRGLIEGAATAATLPLSASGKRGWIERFFQLVNAVGIVIVYGAAEVLLSLLLLVLLAAALLPIPSLDRLILVRLARPLLTNNVGDFHVCLYDRLQAVDVRQSVFEAVTWLVRTAGCDRVVVAAHSGGTVVAADALGTRDVVGMGAGQHALPEHLKKVKTLITFGAALNAAWDEYTYSARSADKPAREIPKGLLYDGPQGTAWLNFWTHFDWALPGRGLDHGPAKAGRKLFSLPVTNGLSPATDHGGYFSNYEEFISRLAQEADSPSTPQNGTEHQRSRFFPGEVPDAERVLLRYARVSMLTWWRFATVSAVAGALVARYWLAGRDAVADSVAIATAIPVVGGAFGAATSGFVLWAVLVLGVTAVMSAAYGLWIELFFAGWHTSMSRRSARVLAPPQAGSMAARTVGFLVVLVVLVLAFALAPAFATIRQAVGLPA